MNAPVLLCEALTGELRPPQTNGAEHYDVYTESGAAGRLTRRVPPSRHPTPGWYVWLEEYGRILRGGDDKVRYFPTPEDALSAMWDALCSSPADLPD